VFDTGPDDKVSVNDRDDFVISWFGAGVNGDGRDLRGSGGGGGGGGGRSRERTDFRFQRDAHFSLKNPFGLKLTFGQKSPCRKLFAHVLGAGGRFYGVRDGSVLFRFC